MLMHQGGQEEEEGEGTRRGQQAARRHPAYQGEPVGEETPVLIFVNFSAV